MPRLISLSFCRVVMLDEWNAPPRRWFAACRRREGFRVLGQAVVDEFGTLSSSVFFAPRALLGKIYDAGIGLGHRRDPEMGIDQGWPPLCVGLEVAAPALPKDWERRLQEALEEPVGGVDAAWGDPAVRRAEVGAYRVDWLGLGGAGLIVTTAPLLPRQLARLCQVPPAAVTVAVATGNRLEHPARGAPLAVTALAEEGLAELAGALRGIAT